MATTTTKKFDFPVPKELRATEIKIFGIGINGDNFVIEFIDKKEKVQEIRSFITGNKHNDLETVRDIIESRLSNFFDAAASGYCTGKLVDVIDRYYDTSMAHAIDKIIKRQKAETEKLDSQTEPGESSKASKEKPVYPIKKFSAPEVNELLEAVIIGGEPLFVQTINGGMDVVVYNGFETAEMKLRPPGKGEYPPDSYFDFESEDELRRHIEFARKRETLYSLYKDVGKFYTKDYFVDTDPKNTVLLTLYTITSYFQDKFSTVPYIWLIGDNGSGKNSILLTYATLGYRVFYMAGASGANICEYLGSVEEGQGTLAEDEVNDLDKDEQKKLLYMNGYASGSTVPKILDGNTKGREQRYFHPYCQKMSASENLPSMKYSKGVMDREFVVKCVKGFPRYNAKAIKKRTNSPEVLQLIEELKSLKKRLFAYRLVHFDDAIEEIAGHGLTISGRALELTEAALSLFHNKYESVAAEDREIFEAQILPVLSGFLQERLRRRNDSLEGKLYPIIRMVLQAQDNEEIDNDTIFNTVWSELEGRELPGKTDIFYVDELGMTVTRSKIMKILKEKFKATNARVVFPDGSTKRGHKISRDVMERIRASYEDEWQIRFIVEDGGDGTNLLLEETSDQVNHQNQVIDQYAHENKDENRSSKGPGTTQSLENSQESELNDTRNAETDQSKGGENSVRINSEGGLRGLGGQSYPIEDSLNSQVSPIALGTVDIDIAGILEKAMLDNQGNNKGYCTLQDLVYWFQTIPNENWGYAEVEGVLSQWIYEGKVEEFQQGKYRPIAEGGA